MNERYICRSRNGKKICTSNDWSAPFDDNPRLERLEVVQPTDQFWFDDVYVWDGDTGAIALGVQIEPVDKFYFMFMAVGPDVESVRAAVVNARNQVTLFSERLFLATSGFR